MISVEPESEGAWLVTVQAGVETQHRVTVSAGDVQRFGGGTAKARDLVEASFRFLLERELNTSILRSFDLPVINRYFPEYEREIAKYLARPS